MLEISTMQDRKLFGFTVPDTIPTQGLDPHTAADGNFTDWARNCADPGFMPHAQVFPPVAFVVLDGSAFDSSMLEIQRQHVDYLRASDRTVSIKEAGRL